MLLMQSDWAMASPCIKLGRPPAPSSTTQLPAADAEARPDNRHSNGASDRHEAAYEHRHNIHRAAEDIGKLEHKL